MSQHNYSSYTRGRMRSWLLGRNIENKVMEENGRAQGYFCLVSLSSVPSNTLYIFRAYSFLAVGCAILFDKHRQRTGTLVLDFILDSKIIVSHVSSKPVRRDEKPASEQYFCPKESFTPDRIQEANQTSTRSISIHF